MKKELQVHVVRCNAAYWYAEVKAAPGPRIEGRGGFTSEEAARAWAHGVRLPVAPQGRAPAQGRVQGPLGE